MSLIGYYTYFKKAQIALHKILESNVLPADIHDEVLTIVRRLDNITTIFMDSYIDGEDNGQDFSD